MRKSLFSLIAVWLLLAGNILLAQDLDWHEIGGENTNCQSLLVAPDNNKIILAARPGSILKTDDAGGSWRRVLSVRGNPCDVYALSLNKDFANVVYAATGNGLYRSNNLGESWERIFSGRGKLERQCLSVFGSRQVILAGTKSGLFISQDNGRSWSLQNFGSSRNSVWQIESSSGEKPVIYLAASGGIYKSDNGGAAWEKVFVSNLRQDAEEENTEADPVGPDQINFVKVEPFNSFVYLASAKGIYRSINQGQSWEKLPEYGLINRNVKKIGLTDGSEICALGASGVFLYRNEHWQEVTFGLSAGSFNDFSLDSLNNIYLACGKGIYKSSPATGTGGLRLSLIQEYLKLEPKIKDVQDAAIKYAEVGAGKISQWRKDAAKKALLPQVSIGIDRNSTDLWHWEGGSTTKSEDDCLRRGRDSIDWDVSLSWDLSDLIWNDAQASIDVRSKLMVELREDILDQVNKLYFERLRVKSELDSLGIEDKNKSFQKQLQLEELTASLDALTAGYYSEQLGLLSLKQDF